jgi:replicative DNA helicase
LIATGARDIPVWSLDDRMRLVPSTLTHAFSSGTKEVFRVRLASGREVQATGNHPFLTYGGWKHLEDLAVGDRVAIPRTTPGPLVARPMPEAATHFGITAVRDDYAAARCTSLRLTSPHHLTHGRRNPIAEWLDSLGLFGLRSYEKFIPDQIFSLRKDQLALFLRHLWATDGSVTIAKSGNVRIFFSTTSDRMARQLLMLLLRFGIVARLRRVGNTYGKPQITVDITGVEEQTRFINDIGVHGKRGTLADLARVRLNEMTAAGRFDTIPYEVWEQVRKAMKERTMNRNRLQIAVGTHSRGDLNDAICPSRSRLARIAAVLEDPHLKMIAGSDVFWDAIASVESIGKHPVYDATVLETHNFVANGTNLHNSIEQDADVVILLHREDAYERESPRAGEADLIVAKHRNGPTATVTVAFQGHYSRFVDMAPG